MDLKLTIFLFAGLSDLIGTSEINVEIVQSFVTVDQLKTMLQQRYPEAKAAIQQAFIAKNQAYASAEERLHESDEIALIPPVSGGEKEQAKTAAPANENEDSPRYLITHEPLTVEAVTNKVIHPYHGAAITFVGTTREFTKGQRTLLLEYDAYIPMALRTMAQIGFEIDERWPGTLVAISHRLGKVEISELSVVIAVSSPHREDCYKASRYAIERLKQIAPIWKKEIWEDGSEWKGHQQGPWNPSVEPESM